MKFFDWYKFIAVFLLSVFLFLLFINTSLFIVFKIRDNYFKPNRVIGQYGFQTVHRAYPALTEKELRKLLDETWSRPFAYESYTGFKERPWKGDYVNVDANGFRRVAGQGPWPPDPKMLNIFVFGGSSTFGYGVADHETVPSYLQAELQEVEPRVRVYNFGRGLYFSLQERVLFEKLLMNGFTPNLAVFIDGINEFHDDGEPRVFELVVDLFEGKAKSGWQWRFPLTRAALSLQQRILKYFGWRGPKTDILAEEKQKAIERLAGNYLRNKQMSETVAELFGVKMVFVWQPSPAYKYDLSYHLFPPDHHSYTAPLYELMNEIKENGRLGKNFLWAADLQENFREALYVDNSHYNSKFSEMLARELADFIKREGFLKP